ncbi:MAG: ABC transporter substrate-binding protein [Aeriscardovia sp.]|nr:ABC transporter substrate-binding protein [Aeriscardovia sp.]
MRGSRSSSRWHKVFRRVAALAAGAAMLVGVAACGNASSSQTSSSASKNLPTVNVMLDWTPNTNHIGMYVAQKLGYYTAEGIKVNILPVSSAGAENAVETGVADLGFSTLSNVAAVDNEGSHLQLIFDLTQKPVAMWCALASNKSIKTPKNFDGGTMVTFGSAEQKAIVREMIKDAGGTGKFKTVTVGTSTFQTLTSGKGTFGGFYKTWEGIESKLYGPKLTCFDPTQWGVPGNPNELGYAVNTKWEATHKSEIQAFVNATARGYAYALAHPDQASQILVDEAKTADLRIKLVKASMQYIIDNNIWGDSKTIAANYTKTEKDKTVTASQLGIGKTNIQEGQSYLNFLYENKVYATKNSAMGTKPDASTLANNTYVEAK